MARLLIIDFASAITVVLLVLFVGLIVYAVRWDKQRQLRQFLASQDHLPVELDDNDVPLEPDESDLLVRSEQYNRRPAMTQLYAEGMNGQIEVDDEYVRIYRKGAMAKVNRGIGGLLGRGIQIRLSDIDDIEISYPRLTQPGWIRFLTGGEDRFGGINEATRDQATVLFRRGRQEAIEELREGVKALIAQRSAQGLAAVIAEGVAAGSSKPDLAQQIRSLAALRDEGILTDDEFQAKKTQLLAEG